MKRILLAYKTHSISFIFVVSWHLKKKGRENKGFAKKRIDYCIEQIKFITIYISACFLCVLAVSNRLAGGLAGESALWFRVPVAWWLSCLGQGLPVSVSYLLYLLELLQICKGSGSFYTKGLINILWDWFLETSKDFLF